MEQRELVLIEWEDSTQPEASWTWLDVEPPDGVVRCQSVGWLILDAEGVKALAPNYGDLAGHIQVSGVIRIPARSITRMTRLTPALLAPRDEGGGGQR